MSTLTRTTSQNTEHAHWSGVFAMTLCVFVLIASEFMPVSLLTPLPEIWALRRVSLAGDRDFRRAGGADQPLPFPACREYKPQTPSSGHDAPDGALGDDYRFRPKLSGLHDRPRADRYRYRRVLVQSAATAIRLVPPHKVARALPIFNGGNALATVVAAPLGSYLGATIGWRGAFLCLVPVAIVAFIWQCLSLPDMNARKNGTSRGSVFRLFRQPAVSVGLLACGLFFMGQFALFTYLRPFLETVTRVSGAGLSLILLTIGVAGFVGTLFVATVLNAAFYITLIAILY